MRHVKPLFAGALFLAASAVVFGQVSLNLAGPIQHFDLAGDSSNQTQANVATTPATFVLGNSFSIQSGTVEVLVPGSFGNQNRFRLRNSAHPGAFADLQVFGNGIDFGEGPVTGVFNSSPVLSGTLVGKTIPVGSTWSVEAFESISNQPNVSDSETSNVEFTLLAGTAATPPAVIDLGTLSDGTDSSITLSYAPAEVKWFKITLPDSLTFANRRYLDLDTEAGSPQVDTEIGFYSESGYRLANDDDSGSSTYSMLSFGPGALARNPVGNGLAYDGRNGELSPGAYYISVARFNATFNPTNFSVTTNAAAATMTLRWRKQVGTPTGLPAFVNLGTLPDSGFVANTSTHGASQVRWYRFTLSENIDAPSGKYLDFDTETTTSFLDTEIAIYNLDGDLVTVDDNDGSGSLSQISYGPNGFTRNSIGGSLSYNGRDGSLLAGTYYLAVGGKETAFANGFVAAGNSVVTGSIVTRYRKGVGVAPPPPAVFTDLGTLQLGSTTTALSNQAAGDVKWYRFNLPVAANATSGEYLDIDNLGTSGFSGDPFAADNDTAMALFGSNGLRIASDDTSGPNFLAMLTFGSGAGDRGDQGTGGSPYDGADGQLEPGTYWLAVTGGSASFDNGWIASTDSERSGNITVNLRYSQAIVASVLSGTVTLNDVGDLGAEQIEIAVYDGATLVGGGSVSMDVLGFYEIPLFNVPDGTYDVYIKGDTFLRKLTTGVVLSGGAATCDATLINGDVNGDNEVGAADFSQLAAAYDAVENDPNFDYNADLNGDLEVGAADFSILAAAYDAVGDELP